MLVSDLANVCKHPKCFRTFKGKAGLRIHLGMAKKCATWYKWVVGRKKKLEANLPVEALHAADDAEHFIPDDQLAPQSTTYPWTTATPIPAGEYHNPTGIGLPWSSSVPLVNHFGNPPIRPPRSPSYPGGQAASTGGGDVECIHSDPFDETFLRVDGDEEEPVPTATHRSESFPGAAEIFGQGLSLLDQIKKDRVELEEECGMYFPFANADDFAVAAWLSKSGASMSSIDKFLKLPFVCLISPLARHILIQKIQVKNTDRLSFRSAQEMHVKIAQLPSPPAWKSRIVKVPGGTTVTPLKLLYRDGLELFKFLFANPVFADHQNFAPMNVWANYEDDIKIFDEPPTGSYMFDVQVCCGFNPS